jgi:hypothetical protein
MNNKHATVIDYIPIIQYQYTTQMSHLEIFHSLKLGCISCGLSLREKCKAYVVLPLIFNIQDLNPRLY